MANVLDRQISVEGLRNVVVKFTGSLDSGNIVETPAIELLDCPTNNLNSKLVGFRVNIMEYSIGDGLEILLQWNGTIPQQIYTISGRGHIDGSDYGGLSPDMTRSGYDGSINLITRNFVPASDGVGQPVVQNFTLTLELIKMYQV